jgi:tRNA(Ile)-lysidine synthase
MNLVAIEFVDVIKVISETIERHNLIPDGMRCVVGISGGADSVGLLRALHQLQFPVTVAHLNHQLRGEESDADEQFVRDLAEELGLPVAVKSVDVGLLAKETGLSLEMAARQARHDFFAKFENSVVALAHHADDQVETFLLKIARGAGTEGLGGMMFTLEIGTIRLIRPMLDIPRSAIVEWLQANRFKWREDASNSDRRFLRNRVRHTVLPLLESELNPNIRQTILRTMAILRAENEWMNEMISDFKFDASDHPVAARRRMLREWLFNRGVEEIGLTAVDRILNLMDAGEGSSVFELNERQRVVVEYGTPRFEDVEQAAWPAPGRLESLPHIRLTTENGTGWKKDHGKGAGILPAEASFDADKVGGAPLEVRAWQPGDRMAPLGMEGSRKLQDILTDQKIPRAQRSAIPVVVCRGEIIWLPGYRTARGWEVQDNTGSSVHVRVE